jgi:hemin uptake protein HemP
LTCQLSDRATIAVSPNGRQSTRRHAEQRSGMTLLPLDSTQRPTRMTLFGGQRKTTVGRSGRVYTVRIVIG